MRRLFTIGHSNHPLQAFLALLERHAVKSVIDVRSAPYSRFNPQYSYGAIRSSLAEAGLGYLYLGRELGPRRVQPEDHDRMRLSYQQLAARESFQAGLAVVTRITANERAALMCAEKEPTACHRTILVARYLRRADLAIHHILADGSLEDHRDSERRLVQRHGLPPKTLFDRYEDQVERAYDLQEERLSQGKGP